MKAEQLMRYDLCRMKLSFGEIWFEDSVGCVVPGNMLEYEPLYITNGFLAKNDWELKNGVMVLKNDVIRLGWKEYGTLIFGYYEWPVKVNYVHQLQHILRDVELVEYANSIRL